MNDEGWAFYSQDKTHKFYKRGDGAVLRVPKGGEEGHWPHFDLELPGGETVKVNPKTGKAEGNKNYLHDEFINPESGQPLNLREIEKRKRKNRRTD